MKFLLLFATLVIFSCSTTQKIERTDITAPYDGKKFNNYDNTDKTFWDVIKWKLTSKKTLWPEWVESEQQTISHERVNGLSVTFINHSTFLIQTDELNILTDPFFSDRASPVSWAGPKRVRKTGVRMEDLPPVDIILISHNHYDHMDKPALKKLFKQFPDAVVYSGLGNADVIKETGFKTVTELDWWEGTQFKGLAVHFVPAKHFSARTLWDRNETLWGGFVLKGNGGYIYFAGDTAKGEHDTRLANRFWVFELALIPIGAYEPRWFMKTSHTNPEEAVQIHKEVNSKFSIGMHFGTVQLTDEGINEPSEGLRKARAEAGLTDDEFIVPEFGATYKVR